MLSNVALSHEGLFGETTAIVDRCIFESCVKVCWLCQNGSAEGFGRFISDGLRTELELKEKIDAAVASRGATLEIEARMLRSITRYIDKSGLTATEISTAKKLPDLAAMIESLGLDRLAYVVGQRIGSHHVHGTWPSLLMHYLAETDDGLLKPRDHDCTTHVNQYVFVPLSVLDAMEYVIQFIFLEPDDATPLAELIESVRREILAINSDVVGSDFERITVT